MPRTSRERILVSARRLLQSGEVPSVAAVSQSAGVSRAGFYRAFGSREGLLRQLDWKEPLARERILESALELLGRYGLAALSMDEVAGRARVSRATLYRLFPGKSSLFSALVHTYSPLEPVLELLERRRAEPPSILMPEIAVTAYRVAAPRIGVLRAILFEVASFAPDAEEGMRDVLANALGGLGGYVLEHMAAGTLRRMHPLLALQSFIGPVVFHVLTRPAAERILGFEMDGEEAVRQLAANWLRAMTPREGETHG